MHPAHVAQAFDQHPLARRAAGVALAIGSLRVELWMVLTRMENDTAHPTPTQHHDDPLIIDQGDDLPTQYDASETARWMLGQLADEMAKPTMLDSRGRNRPKTKAERGREDLRFATICELLWNAEGQPGDLGPFIEATRVQFLTRA